MQEAVTESEKEMAAMRYLAWYGFRDAGTKEFVHTDGETFVDYDGESEYLRELIAGMEYAVLAVGYDDTDHFAGKQAIETFRMAESGVPTGNVQFEVVGTPGIISATTLCTPTRMSSITRRSSCRRRTATSILPSGVRRCTGTWFRTARPI